ncbi:MAG TPA: M23 family metallopeptidase [Caulobacteraceae bacterium]|nr:M23 family metallopeptidase [Caulobacteraceae bacterium]
MHFNGLDRLRAAFDNLFQERHVYVRSDGALTAIVLTPRRQALAAAFVVLSALWMGVCTASMALSLVNAASDTATLKAQAAHAQAGAAAARADAGAVRLTADIEKRNAALALLIGGAKDLPGLAKSLPPRVDFHGVVASLVQIDAVKTGQERLIAQAETYARTRADRLRMALRLAGLTPAPYAPPTGGQGGPLIGAKDPRALAAILDVDQDFAARIRQAALDVSDMRALSDAAGKLPLAKPTDSGARSSGFGVRTDPFTDKPAFHPGLDFSGDKGEPVHVTAPGVVSFTGQRTGYGNTVEVDHGGGFKTRYAHLSRIVVKVGQHVALGEELGAMGSTGRSTGPHLHYEVWVNGRVENPDRFVKAGDYVQQAG